MTKAFACACLAAAAGLAACNDNTTTPTASTPPTVAPNPSPSPSGCTLTMLAAATRDLTREVLDSTPFTTTEPGLVGITVDWKNAQANVGAFVVRAGTCTPQGFNKASCSFLLASGGDKPHRMSAQLPAGSYELLLDYFGAGAKSAPSETAAVHVDETTGSCAGS